MILGNDLYFLLAWWQIKIVRWKPKPGFVGRQGGFASAGVRCPVLHGCICAMIAAVSRLQAIVCFGALQGMVGASHNEIPQAAIRLFATRFSMHKRACRHVFFAQQLNIIYSMAAMLPRSCWKTSASTSPLGLRTTL